ncbi:hypothetical protein BZG36_02515 [Bifiguratus adelaidae]|uniref:Uncharacterized protein n=1 Tax=Bifiguratus adelaidae TaxID=1938954 RepID=A0A261Y2U0_9FUNG|nr:hypothetical protein BZG36_02515 [Bifiguratus adelaidae]
MFKISRPGFLDRISFGRKRSTTPRKNSAPDSDIQKFDKTRHRQSSPAIFHSKQSPTSRESQQPKKHNIVRHGFPENAVGSIPIIVPIPEKSLTAPPTPPPHCVLPQQNNSSVAIQGSEEAASLQPSRQPSFSTASLASLETTSDSRSIQSKCVQGRGSLQRGRGRDTRVPRHRGTTMPSTYTDEEEHQDARARARSTSASNVVEYRVQMIKFAQKRLSLISNANSHESEDDRDGHDDGSSSLAPDDGPSRQLTHPVVDSLRVASMTRPLPNQRATSLDVQGGSSSSQVSSPMSSIPTPSSLTTSTPPVHANLPPLDPITKRRGLTLHLDLSSVSLPGLQQRDRSSTIVESDAQAHGQSHLHSLEAPQIQPNRRLSLPGMHLDLPAPAIQIQPQLVHPVQNQLPHTPDSPQSLAYQEDVDERLDFGVRASPAVGPPISAPHWAGDDSLFRDDDGAPCPPGQCTCADQGCRAE